MSKVMENLPVGQLNEWLKEPQAILLKAEGLHKLYKKGRDQVHAVRDVSLEVKSGEVLVIVGPSGAGKSTLLHLLGGLDRPTRGAVYLDKINLYKIRDTERARIRNKRIGFVFQFYHLLPEFTVLENVMLPALIRREKRENKINIADRARDILGKVGLEDRVTHKPSELSGGEAQRVAIARSLINKPDIVLCDEPTGNLDSKTSSEICSLLHDLNKEEHLTFVIVTHEASLQDLATKVLHIKDGRLNG